MNSIPQYKYKIKVNYDYLLKKYPLTKKTIIKKDKTDDLYHCFQKI